MKLYVYIIGTLCIIWGAHAFAMDSNSRACWDLANSMYYPNHKDKARLQCIQSGRTTLSPLDCKAIADSMYYPNDRDNARDFCIKSLGARSSVSDCMTIADSMYYPSNRDSARKTCIDTHADNISIDECKNIAESMYYPSNRDNARLACIGLIGRNPHPATVTIVPPRVIKQECDLNASRSPAGDITKALGGSSSTIGGSTLTCQAVQSDNQVRFRAQSITEVPGVVITPDENSSSQEFN